MTSMDPVYLLTGGLIASAKMSWTRASIASQACAPSSLLIT